MNALSREGCRHYEVFDQADENCEQKSIQIKYASVAHPRANGQVERANGMILDVTPQCHSGFLSNDKPRTIILCEPK
jgi:hypothetical protein